MQTDWHLKKTPTQVELGWFSWLHFLSNVIILIIQTSFGNAERRKARPSPIWSFNHPNFASLQIPKCSTSFCCYKIRQCSLLNWSNAEIKITVNDSKMTLKWPPSCQKWLGCCSTSPVHQYDWGEVLLAQVTWIMQQEFRITSNTNDHTEAPRLLVYIYRVFFFNWYPPKKLKYGKPRLGVSTLT